MIGPRGGGAVVPCGVGTKGISTKGVSPRMYVCMIVKLHYIPSQWSRAVQCIKSGYTSLAL